MKKHYFISARTQFDNLGDALINKVLFDKMRSKGNLHIDCKNVPDTYQEITKMLPNEIYKKSVLFYLKMIFYRFTGNDVFYILKPGHIFTISDTPKQMMRDIATIFIFLLFKIIGIKLKRFGASWSPFAPISLKMEKIKAFLSCKNGFRDDYSHQFLVKNDFSNIFFCPDLLFYPDYDALKNLNKPKITIAFSFRGSMLNHENINHIHRFMNLIRQQPHFDMIAISQVTRDKDFQNHLIEQLGNNIPHYIYDVTPNGYQQVIDAYKKADIIISNRLHSLLNGAIYGCHPVAFVSPENHKIMGVFKTAQLEHLVINPSTGNDNDLDKIINRSFVDEQKPIEILRTLLKQILDIEL